MLNRFVPRSLRSSFGLVVARHLSLTTSLAQQPKQQATDPIQQLFVNKIREYNEKRKQTTDGLVDATPEVRKSLETTLHKLKNAFGAESEDLLSVPKLNFKEPQIDVSIEKQAKEIIKKEMKITPDDIKKYTGPYGSWSPEYLAKKDAERAEEQKKHDQRSSGVLPG
jgi:F-type H+-transporting ATPase subunit 6